MKENMFTENRNEPITNEKDFTKERLIEIAKDLATFIAEECWTDSDAFDCIEGIGLTREETEFLLGHKKEEDDE